LAEIPVAAPAPPPEPPPAPDDHRIAELEHELVAVRRRLDAAEEHVAAATQRVLELETDLDRATTMLAAVREAVGAGD
jgi:chromosome segregation ATPase